MASLTDDIAQYDLLRNQLEIDHTGEWVVIHDRNLIGLFKSFEAAADEAVRQFGRGPYLIRQVGAPPIVLSPAMMYGMNRG